jgi:hypothetical protein
LSISSLPEEVVVVEKEHMTPEEAVPAATGRT